MKDFKKAFKQLTGLNSNYGATREELREFLDQLDGRRAKFQERLIELRMQARDLMTSEEWQAVYAKAKEKTSK